MSGSIVLLSYASSMKVCSVVVRRSTLALGVPENETVSFSGTLPPPGCRLLQNETSFVSKHPLPTSVF